MTARPEGVLVLGVPRCGTTLIRRILDAHPNIACPPETSLFSGAAAFLGEHRLDHGVRFGVPAGLEQAGFSRDDVFLRTREFVFSFLRDFAARRGKPRWAEKTAASVFHVDAIEALCGESVQYVAVVRHALDAAVSMKELTDRSGGSLAELHRYQVAEHRPVVAFARAWIDATRLLLALRERRTVHLLRYEDLVEQPLETTRGLFEFLGEDFSDVLLARAFDTPDTLGFGDWKTWSKSTFDAGSVGRWKREVSRDLRDELAPELNPLLETLGYQALPPPAGPTSDGARRIEIAMRLAAARKGS